MPKFRVVTEKVPDGREVEAPTAASASQRTPGKTLSVVEVFATAFEVDEDGHLPEICPPDCAVDHDAKWRKEAPKPTTTDDALAMATAAVPVLDADGKFLRPLGPLTPELQAKHDKKFGKVKPVAKKKKGVPIKRQAEDLLAAGTSWIIIEDVLNLSASRSKALRAELNAFGDAIASGDDA
jgi:hypothetical protein